MGKIEVRSWREEGWREEREGREEREERRGEGWREESGGESGGERGEEREGREESGGERGEEETLQLPFPHHLTFILNTPAWCKASDRRVPEFSRATSARVALRMTSHTKFPKLVSCVLM